MFVDSETTRQGLLTYDTTHGTGCYSVTTRYTEEGEEGTRHSSRGSQPLPLREPWQTSGSESEGPLYHEGGTEGVDRKIIEI